MMSKLRMMGVGVTLALSGGVLSLGAAQESQRMDAQNGATQWTQQSERLIEASKKVSDMTGNRVRNHQGERLGSVNDLIIKLPSGEIEYAVIASGGVFGVGGTNRLVPYGHLSMADDEDEFRLDIGEDMWGEAPEFDRDEMAELESDGFRDQLRETLGLDNGSERRSGDRDERRSRDDDRYDNAGTDRDQQRAREQGEQQRAREQGEQQRARQQSEQQRARQQGEQQRSREQGERAGRQADGMDAGSRYLVTDVLSYDVVDAEDESVGRVSDFLIGDDDEKISHVVLSIGGFLRIGDEKLAVSPEELDFDKEEEKVRLPVSKQAFSDERTDDDDNWFERIFN